MSMINVTLPDGTINEYAEGISCPNCYNTHSEDRKKRFSERQKQIKLAKERGEKHIGKTFKANDA